MKQINIIFIFFTFSALLFTSSCVSLTGFNTGRTTPKGAGEFNANLTVVETVDYERDSTTFVPTLYVPVVEVGGRFGIIERLDAGIRISTTANILIDAKYQFVGTQDSPLAMAIGAGVGFTPLASLGITVFNFQVPLSISYHPTEKIHIYVSPRYIYQRAGQISQFFGSANYSGWNAGVLFGKEFKFGLDVGNYRLRGDGGKTGLDYDRKNLFNAGLGMFFTFGGNKEGQERRGF
ncbi:MAG: hypothetical protein AB8F74_10005 [Saprospiraceae bacterium]